MFHGNVCRGIGRDGDRVKGKLSLPREHRGYTAAPGPLNSGEDTQLVVHQHVVLSGVAMFNVLERLLLVNIDEDIALDGFKDSGALHLARLEYHVAICENDCLAPFAESFQHLERPGVKPIRKWIINQVVGGCHEVRFVGMFDPVAL